MGVIREVIYEIDFYSPPLKRHRYNMSSVGKQYREPTSGGTGALFDEVHRRDIEEKKASGILEKHDELPSLPPLSGEEIAVAPPPDFSYYKTDEAGNPINPVTGLPIILNNGEDEQPKRRFRSLKRLEKMIYDDTAERIAELEDEAFLQLNADGYYDEILPDDADEDIPIGEAFPLKQVVVIGGLTLILAVVFVFYIRSIF